MNSDKPSDKPAVGRNSDNTTNTPAVRMHIDHITIAVTDLAESETFYRDVLGAKQVSEPFKEGRHVWFDLGGAELHAVRSAEKRIEHPRGHHFCIRVDDMDAFTERLKTHGVTYTNSKGEKNGHNIRPDGARQIYFTDPDGYWIEVNDAW